ncbi:MAG TPA: ChaN family lipoprotein [Chthoniobacterales bacterium]
MKRSCILFLAAGLTSGCAHLGQPPLPQGAATSAPAAAPIDQAWATKLEQADAVYFSLTKSETAEIELARQIIAVVQRSGRRLAVGWAEIPANQQPLFDQWKEQEISPEQLLDRLARPKHDTWLRQSLHPDLAQVALGSSPSLLRKIRDGESLSADERAQLPDGFHAHQEALENFAEGVTSSPRLRRYNVARLYRMHLIAEQIIAENIVRFRREHAETKLLIFLPNDILINVREVAAFVRQKLPMRQLILDRAQPLEERPQLLAGAPSGRLKIVDRAPRAAPDNRRLPPPRLRA